MLGCVIPNPLLLLELVPSWPHPPPSLLQPCSFCFLPTGSTDAPCWYKPIMGGGLCLTPTYTLFIYRHRNISHVWACVAWGLTCGSNLSQHWEMKWYTEIIQRWLTNEQDLMSNPNIFRQHEPWLHGHTPESPAPWAVWGTLQTSAKNYHWVKVSVLDPRQSTQKQWKQNPLLNKLLLRLQQEWGRGTRLFHSSYSSVNCWGHKPRGRG